MKRTNQYAAVLVAAMTLGGVQQALAADEAQMMTHCNT